MEPLLIGRSLDSGLGACLWAPAPDSHASPSTNHWRKMSACWEGGGGVCLRLWPPQMQLEGLLFWRRVQQNFCVKSVISSRMSFLLFFLKQYFVALWGGGGVMLTWRERQLDAAGNADCLYKVKVWRRSNERGATELRAAGRTCQQRGDDNATPPPLCQGQVHSQLHHTCVRVCVHAQACAFVCVYLLHYKYQNTISTIKVRTFLRSEDILSGPHNVKDLLGG